MGRNLAFSGVARPANRSLGSLACLAFVVFLGLAFWAGALWIGHALLQIGAAAL